MRIADAPAFRAEIAGAVLYVEEESTHRFEESLGRTMTRRVSLSLMLTLVLAPASTAPLAAAQRLVDVRQVATDTLRDVAVATYERGRPVIYYNPTLIQRVGPELADFFLAHEYGHIAYGHAGGALAEPREDWSALRQKQELEADCYATQILAEENRPAVEAALQFFGRMGPFRFDNLHPSGSQRAAKILACLPSTPADHTGDPRNSSRVSQ